jgi:hypothetical protein
LPTATEAATATAVPAPTFSGENAAVCTAIAAAQGVLEAGPTISATTGLAELQTYLDEISAATNAVTAAAEQSGGIDLARVNAAFGVLDGLVNVLAGDTVGNAAATVSPALRGVRTAYADLRTAASCD